MANNTPPKLRRCRYCDVAESAELRLSKRRMCPDCAMSRASEAGRQMAAKSGPYYDRWTKLHRVGFERYLRSLNGPLATDQPGPHARG